MKKIIFLFVLSFVIFSETHAQKYAIIDTQYILGNVPAYESAQEQLNKISVKWQTEVDAVLAEAHAMYSKYQTEGVYLAAAEKTKREQAIVAKEKEARDLKTKYFGAEGELFKKRESLVKPIQDEVYSAIKEMAETNDYVVIFDKSSASGIVYSNAKYDISDQILQKLGYSK